jgi:N-acetylmuramoyl-L-alanine amidase
LQKQIQEALKASDSSIGITLIDGSQKNLKTIVQQINQGERDLTTQNIAIELLTDYYPKYAKVGGISVYYNGSNIQAKNYATVLLKKIDQTIPKFGVGAYSDLQTTQRRLMFCRQTTIPALVFFAGYLSNSGDRTMIEGSDKLNLLAKGIALGLSTCLKSIYQQK